MQRTRSLSAERTISDFAKIYNLFNKIAKRGTFIHRANVSECSMTKIKVKTSELVGPALHWAVAQAVARDVKITISRKVGSNHLEAKISCIYPVDKKGLFGTVSEAWTSDYAPSSDWAQSGALLESISLRMYQDGNGGFASVSIASAEGHGANLQVALCRAIVQKWGGDSVDIPAELNVGLLQGQGVVLPEKSYIPQIELSKE